MKIKTKLILGDLSIAALTSIVGFIGIRSVDRVSKEFNIDAKPWAEEVLIEVIASGLAGA
jgi:hypothetical protein